MHGKTFEHLLTVADGEMIEILVNKAENFGFYFFIIFFKSTMKRE